MTDSSQARVLIAIPFDTVGIQRLQEIAEVDYRPHITAEELETVIGGYQGLIVSSEGQLPDQVIEAAYKMQVIGVTGASLGHLNVSAARAQDVKVINVPNRRTLALAEQTLGMMLTLGHRQEAVGLAGRTLGIVGFGAVGHEVARRAQAFGMHVLVNQPRLTPELALEAGVEACDLQALLCQADYVSLHLPTTPETHHLIDRQALERCPRKAILINAGSLEAVDPAALMEALHKGQLAGAALAVPPGAGGEWRALEHPNLLISEMRAPSQKQVERDVARELAQKMGEQLRKRRTGNPLSLRVVPLEHVLPHEYFDPERVRGLAERIAQAETFTNPPVVVEWEGYYVVLDGATRTTAFRELGYPHVIVQVAAMDDERLVLHTWYHAVTGLTPKALLAHLRSKPEYILRACVRQECQTEVDAHRALCSLHLPGEGDFLAYAAEGVDPLAALNSLVFAYTEVGSIQRTLSTDLNALSSEAPELAGLVIFPQFSIPEVMKAAVSRQLLPAGITRFIIPGRVLRLHADLARLRSEETLASKNAWLDALLAEKLARQKVRYYQEPVYLLDE